MLATSIPAAASASKAAVPAEKANRFPGSGRPPEPTDVSRLTIARSAAASAVVAGVNAEAGRSRRGASAPSKCTSPATAMSTGAGRGSRGAGAAGVGGGVSVVEPAGARDESGDDGSVVALQPAAAPPTTSASTAPQRRTPLQTAPVMASWCHRAPDTPPEVGVAPWADGDTLRS